MAAVNPESPPPLWELTFDNRPRSEEQCLAALSFLAAHPNPASEWSKQCADLLARTDISSLPEAEKTMDTLFAKCPTLFPCIKVTIGNQAREIPKARLCLLSEKFAAQLSSGFREQATQTIDLTAEDPSIAQSFLDYLATGELDITVENAIPLFTLADAQGVLPLIQSCSEFLTRNLDASSFSSLLQHAVMTNHPDLLWVCHAHLSQLSATAQSSNVSLSYDNGIRTVSILDVDALTPQALAALESLHASCGIRGLVIKKATSLDSLNFIKTLDVVRIGTDKVDIKVLIPESWLQSAKIIQCIGCTSLTTLDAPKATKVDCKRCTSLTTLEIPNASEVWCSHCSSLKTLNVPKATKIFCEVCTSLTTLNAPEATLVSCTASTSLTTLNAPKADVFCQACTSLITLSTPQATMVSCSGCTSLTILNAPKAASVKCIGCTSLTTLNAPKAAYISCSECKSLTILNAPNATEVDCRGCTSLTTIKVAKGCVIEGRPEGCTVEYVG